MTGIAEWSAHRRATDPEWAARYRVSRREAERRRRSTPEYRARTRAAYQANRAAAAATSANKQARLLGAVGTLSAEDVRLVWDRQPLCLNCDEGQGLDHIVAMARGGTNTPDNIQNLCLICNQAKHTRDLAPGRIIRPPLQGDAERCRRGHLRATSMRTVPSGHRYCRPCHSISAANVPSRKKVPA